MAKILGGKATYIYGTETSVDDVQELLPRQRFQFSARIHHRSNIGGVSQLNIPRIASIDMPGYSVNTATLNQFNKKRTIQTGISYTPVSIVAYDTRDTRQNPENANIESFLRDYTQYYYSGVFNRTADLLTQDDIVSAGFIDGNSGTGYALPEDKYFISKIEILRKSTQETNRITLFNPMLTQVDGDRLDYADSNPVQYSLQFTYESFNIETL